MIMRMLLEQPGDFLQGSKLGQLIETGSIYLDGVIGVCDDSDE